MEKHHVWWVNQLEMIISMAMLVYQFTGGYILIRIELCNCFVYLVLWLVGSNMFYVPFHIWDNPSHWLSYFSRWLKPPNRYNPYNPYIILYNPTICIYIYIYMYMSWAVFNCPKSWGVSPSRLKKPSFRPVFTQHWSIITCYNHIYGYLYPIYQHL